MGKFANKLLVECQLTLPVHPGFQKDPQALQDGNAVRFYCCGWWERYGGASASSQFQYCPLKDNCKCMGIEHLIRSY